jgi:hypothetical protein
VREEINWGRAAVYGVLVVFCLVFWVGLVVSARWILEILGICC